MAGAEDIRMGFGGWARGGFNVQGGGGEVITKTETRKGGHMV
jgi:hypothetical protein